MSTRATVWFQHSKDSKPTAIVYRHPDGYPEGLGLDLLEFVDEIRKNVPDTRFTDPSYLAAKWVVWDAKRYAVKYDLTGTALIPMPCHPLNFISVGIVMEDPGDIEFRYHVICDGKPTILAETARGKKVAMPEKGLPAAS